MFKNKKKKKIALYKCECACVCSGKKKKKKTVSNFYFKLRRKARDQLIPGLNLSFFYFQAKVGSESNPVP